MRIDIKALNIFIFAFLLIVNIQSENNYNNTENENNLFYSTISIHFYCYYSDGGVIIMIVIFYYNIFISISLRNFYVVLQYMIQQNYSKEKKEKEYV